MHISNPRTTKNCTPALPLPGAPPHNGTMEMHEVLRKLMKNKLVDGKPISQKKLAELSGAEQTTIHRILARKIKNPYAESLQPLAAFFGISLAQLRGEAPMEPPAPLMLHGVGLRESPNHYATKPTPTPPKPAKPRMIPVPVVGTAQLGDNAHWSEMDFPVGHGDGYIDFPVRDPGTYALRCKGDSMVPRIKDGEFVVVEPGADPIPGDEVLVKARDGRVMVKIYLYRRDGRLHLMSINEAHPPLSIPLAEVDKIHPVLAIIKKNLWRTA